ncbi:hypothetical protein TRIUR3_20941 [Triticum urartu]|uniref:Uncharacterized protein n=1 Tax=Triticum urartu TaxID=4572 RepID=M8A5J2_TRIUA|nr:hypothetical protein TRIUR3_20941 [Triticum urartu]
MSRIASSLNVGFVAGVLFVLLVYFLVQQQEAISSLSVATTAAVSQWMTDKQLIKAPGEIQQIKAPGEILVASDVHRIADKQPIQDPDVASDVQPISDKEPIHDSEKGEVVCTTESETLGHSETCEVDGDVRTNGTALSVTLVPASWKERREWMISPYSKAEIIVKNVTVTQLQDRATAPPCTVTHSMPAVLFAIAGHAGNYWHDYTDILVPLFVASRRYRGEVTFLISNIQYRPEWLVKYKTLLRGLSKHAWVDMEGDTEVRCFPHVTVGLRVDKELTIVPEVVPYGNIEVLARAEFSEPVTDMGLKYLDYSVSVEESSLLETLGPEHPAIKDPESIHRSGWTNMFEFYLAKQNVRINTTRFAPTLAQAFDHLRQQ